jgi:hypothetical protein
MRYLTEGTITRRGKAGVWPEEVDNKMTKNWKIVSISIGPRIAATKIEVREIGEFFDGRRLPADG